MPNNELPHFGSDFGARIIAIRLLLQSSHRLKFYKGNIHIWEKREVRKEGALLCILQERCKIKVNFGACQFQEASNLANLSGFPLVAGFVDTC